MINSIKKISVLMSIILLLSSCSIPLTCILYNNSGQRIIITKYKEGYKNEVYVVEKGEQSKVNEWELERYSVKLGDDVYFFETQLYEVPDEKYIDYRGAFFWGKRIIRLQIEMDGKIYLLKSNEKYPLNNFLSQPKGFPLDLRKKQ